MAKGLPDPLKFLENRRAPQKRTEASLAGKVCVITGATSGVGLSAARRFARGGASLVLLARSAEKAERVRAELSETCGVPVSVVLADFTDLAQVRAAAEELLRTTPRIDVLVNNAGMHATKRSTTPAGIETVLCVNHLAPFLLTRLLLPLLVDSGARILDVNSEGHRFSAFHPDDILWKRHHYTGLKGYGASKTAQLLTVWEFADRLAGSGATIVAMHPGDVRTNIGSNNGRLYRWFGRHVTARLLKDVATSGEALYYLAAAPELSGVSGRFFHLTVEEKPAPHALDRSLGKRVWSLSNQWVGLPDA
jgi:NAD(P)-dependent dehydrogenase (short-subunit alcohol dehydrogenase family)